MERIVGEYDRISRDKRGTEEGIETQQFENGEAAEQLGLTVSERFVDNDLSAYFGVERPDYRRLLEWIAADRIDTVIVWHANRLHRNTDEVNPFIRLARAHKVRLYSTTKGGYYNLETAAGRKELRNDTSDAEYESEHRGERVSIARKRQARNGDYGGGVRPYGWGVDTGRVRSVCVNPKAPAMERVYEDRPVLDMSQHNRAEAAEIRRMARDLLSGVSMNQVMRDLARRGVPTAAMTDGRTVRRNGREVDHKGWNSRSIREILTHPRTSGHSVYRGEIIRKNAYPPILDEDVRQALITILTDPKRKTAPGNTPKWLGSLIFRCGKCDDGTTMTVRKRYGVDIYRCRKAGHCSWPAERVNAYIEEAVIARLSRDDLVDLIPQAENIDAPALREEIKVLEARKIDAARRYSLDKIDGDQMETITAAINERITAINAKLKNATHESPLAEFVTSQDVRKTWKDCNLGRQREILRRLFTITLYPLGRGYRFNRDLIDIRGNGPQNRPDNPPAHAHAA